MLPKAWDFKHGQKLAYIGIFLIYFTFKTIWAFKIYQKYNSDLITSV